MKFKPRPKGWEVVREPERSAEGKVCSLQARHDIVYRSFLSQSQNNYTIVDTIHTCTDEMKMKN